MRIARSAASLTIAPIATLSITCACEPVAPSAVAPKPIVVASIAAPSTLCSESAVAPPVATPSPDASSAREPTSGPWAKRIGGKPDWMGTSTRALVATRTGGLAVVVDDASGDSPHGHPRVEIFGRNGEPKREIEFASTDDDRIHAIGPDGTTLWANGEFNRCSCTGCQPPIPSEVVIALRDPAGAVRWHASLSGQEAVEIQIRQAAIGPSGDAVVIGDVRGKVAIGCAKDAAVSEDKATFPTNFVARFDAAGRPRWIRPIHGMFSNDVAIDGSGDVVVIGGGGGRGTVVVGDLRTPCRPDADEPMLVAAVIAKLDADGATSWVKCAGTAAIATQLAVGAHDDIAVRGEFKQTRDFGAGPLGPAGSFVALFSYSGALQWSRRLGRYPPYAHGLAIDPSGDVYISLGDRAVGGSPATRTSDVVRLDPAGKPIWTKKLVQPFPDPTALASKRASDATVTDIVIDETGAVVVGGRTPSAITIDGTTLAEATGADTIFLSRLAP